MTDPIRITLGGYQGPASVHTRGLQMLRDALAERCGDRVEVVLRPNMAEDGYGTADLPGLAESGLLDGCYISSSYLAARVPALSLFDMPFGAPEHARAFAMLDGALGARLAREVESHTDLALLGIWDNGMRHMASAGTPLRRPSDGAGLVLRTLPNADHQRVFRALGFEPRAVDAKDLAGAVARGEVGAQENPLTNTLNFGLHETLPVITLTGHLMGIALVLFNRARIKAWPEEIRLAVEDAVAQASHAQRALAREDEAVSAKALAASGATLVELSEADRDAWRAATAPELARRRAEMDPALLALFEGGTETEKREPA